MRTLLISHTWLRHNHDTTTRTLMKRLLGDILAGTAGDIHPQWALPDHASARRSVYSRLERT